MRIRADVHNRHDRPSWIDTGDDMDVARPASVKPAAAPPVLPYTPPAAAPDTHRVKAPGFARGWKLPRPELNGFEREAPDGSLAERALDRLPDSWRDKLMDKVGRANNRLFPSRPAGAPIPRNEGSWTFAALGDYGAGTRAQAAIAANIVDSKPDLVVTTGDNVYYRGTEKEWREKWDPYMAELRSKVPMYPSIGNHDQYAGTDAYFRRFPELGKARFYSFDHKNAHFVSLNSNESLAPGSPQYKWLEQDLAQAKEGWKVLYFHHPMYSSAPRGRDGKIDDYLAPLLAKHGVDLVLTGHEHWYERAKPNAGGTTQVMTGNGGNTLHPITWKQGDWSATRHSAFGHVEFEVTDDALIGRHILRNGTVQDSFRITDVPAGGVQNAAEPAAAAAASAAVVHA